MKRASRKTYFTENLVLAAALVKWMRHTPSTHKHLRLEDVKKRSLSIVLVCVAVAPLISLLSMTSVQAQSISPDDLGGDDFEVEAIFVEQEITLDLLPMALIYQPPGANGQQSLSLTENFATRTSMSHITTSARTVSAGVNLLLMSTTVGDTTTTSYNSESGAWQIRVSGQSWSTFLPNEFPANGDRIVFFRDPQFLVRSIIGYKIKPAYPGMPEEQVIRLDTPVVTQVRPINADEWPVLAPSIRAVRNGTSTASLLTMDERNKLLNLDPFIRQQEQPVVKGVLFAGLPGQPTFWISTDPNPVEELEENPVRFLPQGNPVQWSMCDGSAEYSLSMQSGISSSSSETKKFVSSITQAGGLKVSVPVGPLGLPLGASFSVGDKAEFSYTRNRMASTAHTTAVNVVLGGPGLSPCPEGTPIFETKPFYDTTFGVYLFPTRPLNQINVVGMISLGSVSGPMLVTATRTSEQVDVPKAISAIADSTGAYRMQLPPGDYEVTTQRGADPTYDSRRDLTVPVIQPEPIRIDPLILE